jgi:hypothetical protein
MTTAFVMNHSLHSLNLKEGSPAERTIKDGSSNDSIQKYASEISKELISSPRSRAYIFHDDQELVASCIVGMLDDLKWPALTEKIANKLFQVEVEAQEKISSIAEIKTGGLLQIKLIHNSQVKIILVKVDINDFLTEQDVEIRSGLPFGKDKIQKTAMITIDDDGVPIELLVSDSRAKITEYWYKYFLVAREIKDDELNTKNAFNSIEKILNSDVKNVSSKDYWYLRNDIVSYFRNEESFLFEDILNIFNRHKVESKALGDSMPKIIKKIEELPKHEKNGFDKQFDLQAKCIKAKIKRSIYLDENIELSIKGEISDFGKRISPHKDDNGRGIVIYSESGYLEFGGE